MRRGGGTKDDRVKVLGVVGWSGSGKTTLIERVLPLLRATGISVSTVKHAHHGFDMDRPGKDSYRHRAAGAREVMVVSGGRWALLHEAGEAMPPLSALLDRLTPVDLVLVEGFKTYPFPKLEVWRPALGKPPIWPDEAGVLAVATDARGKLPPAAGQAAPRLLDLDDPAAVAEWMLAAPGGRRDSSDVFMPGAAFGP